MAWLAVDADGMEVIFHFKPKRGEEDWIDEPFINNMGYRVNNAYIHLPHGSIAKLIGRELTWEDEPVELANE